MRRLHLRRGGHSLIWPKRGYVPLNRVWFSGPQLRLKQGIEQPAFLGRKALRECQGLRWVVYICSNQHFLFQNI